MPASEMSMNGIFLLACNSISFFQSMPLIDAICCAEFLSCIAQVFGTVWTWTDGASHAA
jgi:hypothetical protein